MNTLCLAEQEPDNVGRKILATGEEPLKVRVISRHSFRLISLLKILVGLTKTQAKGKHNSAVRARHSSNRQTPIWPFGVYVYLWLFSDPGRGTIYIDYSLKLFGRGCCCCKQLCKRGLSLKGRKQHSLQKLNAGFFITLHQTYLF